MLDRDRVFAEFEQLGELEVRTRVASGFYSEERKAFAEIWLLQKEREANAATLARTEALLAEQLIETRKQSIETRKQSIATRSAKNAAWASAIGTVIAAVCAVIAVLRR